MFTGHQEVRVQEKAQCLAVGATPEAITAVLQDELADAFRPGGEIRSPSS
jgi:DNA replicative helicase MCM subunit Mcm2 (Cdc46/Mcm family)